jgi:hypothetical protein
MSSEKTPRISLTELAYIRRDDRKISSRQSEEAAQYVVSLSSSWRAFRAAVRSEFIADLAGVKAQLQKPGDLWVYNDPVICAYA